MVMVRWSDRWIAGEAGPPVLYRHHACGDRPRRPALCGMSIGYQDTTMNYAENIARLRFQP